MPFPIAVNLMSKTTPVGPAPNAVAPPGMVIAIGTVFAGPAHQPVATVGSKITPHGNPKLNKICPTKSVVVTGIPNVLVMGKPVAVVGSLCSCGHALAIGIPNILVGGSIG